MKRCVWIVLAWSVCAAAQGQSDLVISASSSFEEADSSRSNIFLSPAYLGDDRVSLFYPFRNELRYRGKIGTASSQIAGPTIEWGSSYTNGETAYYGFEAVHLSPNKVLILGGTEINYLELSCYAQVANISDSVITYSTPYIWTSKGSTYYWALDAEVISSSKVVLTYVSEQADTDKGSEEHTYQGKSLVITIAEDDSITFGDYVYLPIISDTWGQVGGLATARLKEDKIVAVYQAWGEGVSPDEVVVGVIGTVSDETISYGTYSVCWDITYTEGVMNLTPLTDDRYVYSYVDWYDTSVPGYPGRSRLVWADPVEDTVTFYDPTEFCSYVCDDGLSTVALDSGNFIVSFHGDGASYSSPEHAYARIGYVSGTSIIFKASEEFTANSYLVSGATIGSSTVVIVYQDEALIGRSNIIFASSLEDTPVPESTPTYTPTFTPTFTPTPTSTPTPTPTPLLGGLALNCTPDLWDATSASRGDGGNRKIPSEIDLSYAEDPPLLKDLANAGVLVQPYSYPLYEEVAEDFLVNGTALFRDYAYFCKPPVIEGESYERTQAFRYIMNATGGFARADMYEGTATFVAPATKPHWLDFQMDNDTKEVEFNVFYSNEDDVVIAAADTDWRLKDRANFVCDGYQDGDTINHAMELRPDAKRFHLLAGTYNIDYPTHITPPTDYITIYGDGDDTLLRIEGNGGSTMPIGINAIGRIGTTVQKMRMETMDSFMEYTVYGVRVDNATSTVVEDVSFYDMQNGVRGDYAHNTQVRNCYFNGVEQAAVDLYHDVYGRAIGNFVEDGGDGFKYVAEARDNIILNLSGRAFSFKPATYSMSTTSVIPNCVKIDNNYISGVDSVLYHYGFSHVGADAGVTVATHCLQFSFTNNYCRKAIKGIRAFKVSDNTVIENNIFEDIGYATPLDEIDGWVWFVSTGIVISGATQGSNITIARNKFYRANIYMGIETYYGQPHIIGNMIKDSSCVIGIYTTKCGWPEAYKDEFPIGDRPPRYVSGVANISDNIILNFNQANYTYDLGRPAGIYVDDGAVVNATPCIIGTLGDTGHEGITYGYPIDYAPWSYLGEGETYDDYYVTKYGVPWAGRVDYNIQGNHIHIDSATGDPVGIHLRNPYGVVQSCLDVGNCMAWPDNGVFPPVIQFSFLNATIHDNIMSGTGIVDSIVISETENASFYVFPFGGEQWAKHPALVNADIFDNVCQATSGDDGEWDYLIMPELGKYKTFHDNRRNWRIGMATDSTIEDYPLTVGHDYWSGNSAYFTGAVNIAGEITATTLVVSGTTYMTPTPHSTATPFSVAAGENIYVTGTVTNYIVNALTGGSTPTPMPIDMVTGEYVTPLATYQFALEWPGTPTPMPTNMVTGSGAAGITPIETYRFNVDVPTPVNTLPQPTAVNTPTPMPTSIVTGDYVTPIATYQFHVEPQPTADLSGYLPLAGGTMSGDINMGVNSITNALNIEANNYTFRTWLDNYWKLGDLSNVGKLPLWSEDNILLQVCRVLNKNYGSLQMERAYTLAYPNYSFITDTNTGIAGGITADEFSLITGGSERGTVHNNGLDVLGALDVSGGVNAATGYFSGDVSADSFTEFCRFPDDTVDALKEVSALRKKDDGLTGWGELDHASLPAALVRSITFPEQKYQITNKLTFEDAAEIPIRLMDNRTDIKDVKELVAAVLFNYEKENEEVVLPKEVIDYPEKFDAKLIGSVRIETGRDLGGTVSLNSKAIADLLKIVRDLEKKVAVLEERVKKLEGVR